MESLPPIDMASFLSRRELDSQQQGERISPRSAPFFFIAPDTLRLSQRELKKCIAFGWGNSDLVSSKLHKEFICDEAVCLQLACMCIHIEPHYIQYH